MDCKIGDRFKLSRDCEGHKAGEIVTLRTVTGYDEPFEECTGRPHHYDPKKKHVHGVSNFLDITNAVLETPPNTYTGFGFTFVKNPVQKSSSVAMGDVGSFWRIKDNAEGRRAGEVVQLCQFDSSKIRPAVLKNEAGQETRHGAYIPGIAYRLQVAATAAAAAAPAPKLSGRREVSHDGRTWVNYKTLGDSDAFETYKYRRVLKDGKVVEEHTGAPAVIKLNPVAALGTCGWAYQAEPGGPVTKTCKERVTHAKSPFCERHVAMAMKKLDSRRKVEARAPEVSPLANRRFLDGAERPWEMP